MRHHQHSCFLMLIIARCNMMEYSLYSAVHSSSIWEAESALGKHHQMMMMSRSIYMLMKVLVQYLCRYLMSSICIYHQA